MISTESKKGAASAAKRIISTAPIEKFGAMRTPTPGALVELRAQGGQPVVVEAGGADHGVDAVLDAEGQVGHDDVGVGEVDDRLGAGGDQVGQVVVDVDPRHQLEVVGRLDGGADLAADLALGAEHADLPHLSHAPTL